MPTHDLVVIGASAGGVSALRTLVARFEPDFPAAICIVLHVGAHTSRLPELLSLSGPLPARHAADGDMLRPGQILVAPPDHHLLIYRDHVRVTRGPKENHTRPAIDPLFRSAALSHGARAIAVVLTGRLDDGSAGVQAIRDCGGRVVVQDPGSSEGPEMPVAALRVVEADRCVPLDAMAANLLDLLRRPEEALPVAVPQNWIHEHQAGLGEGAAMDDLKAIAQPSTFVCPECGGALWEIDGSGPPRYRCHTGHAYSMRSLDHGQARATDEALEAAIRALHERELLLRRMASLDHEAGDTRSAHKMAQDAADVAAQVELLRAMADAGGPGNSPEAP